MKKITCLLLLVCLGNFVFAQKGNQNNNQPGANKEQGVEKDDKKDQNKAADEKKENFDTTVKINPGSSGVKRSIGYKFISPSSSEKPADGTFHFNNDTVAKVSYIIVDDEDVSGDDQSKWYSTWDDTTGATARGRITLVESEGRNSGVFDVEGVFTHQDGFWKIPVKFVSGTNLLNGSTYYYVFERIAHKKEQAKEDTKPDLTITAQAEQPKPVEEVKPAEEPKPVEEVKPVEDPKPVEEAKPVEEPKHVEEVKPVEEPKPVEEAKPVEEPKPVEEAKPAEEPKPVEEVKPAEEPKPVGEVKPAEEPKPVEEVKPAEEPKPVVEVKPAEEPKPVVEVKPAEEPKQVEEVKQVEEPKPVEVIPPEQPKVVEEARVVEQPKPIEEIKPVEQSKPTGETKPAEQPKPVEVVKPAEQPKPVVEVKPVEEPKQAVEFKQVEPQKPAEEKKPAEQAVPPVAEQKAEPKPGINRTSQVTQGVKTEQTGAAPPSYQSNLPTYQYRYSSNKRGRGKWYAGIIEAGYGLGVGEYGIDNFRINFINGFRIGKTFSAGLGIGVRRYYVEQEKFVDHSLVSGKVQIPVFLDLRKTFSTNTVTPYIALGIGNAARYTATADTTGSVNEGFLFNPSGGIWFNISSRFAVFCGVAYEMQKMEYLLLSDETHYKKNTSSVSLNIGIAF